MDFSKINEAFDKEYFGLKLGVLAACVAAFFAWKASKKGGKFKLF